LHYLTQNQPKMLKYCLQNILLTILFVLIFTEFVNSQAVIRQKSVMGQAGSSKNINQPNKTYYYRQSIGQYGIQGSYTHNKLSLVQGFIHPFLLQKQLNYPSDLKVDIKNISNNDVYIISIKEQTEHPFYLSLYNLKGQNLYYQRLEEINEYKLDLSSYNSGCYILYIRTDVRKFSTRLVKTH
jgi:hypothetical protein